MCPVFCPRHPHHGTAQVSIAPRIASSALRHPRRICDIRDRRHVLYEFRAKWRPLRLAVRHASCASGEVLRFMSYGAPVGRFRITRLTMGQRSIELADDSESKKAEAPLTAPRTLDCEPSVNKMAYNKMAYNKMAHDKVADNMIEDDMLRVASLIAWPGS
jgi:hypothetical protein